MTTTWRMAVGGVTKGIQMLKSGGDVSDVIESAIRGVEDFPCYRSVGYGGLPNEETEMEIDAAFMDGNTLDIGVVTATRDFANPVSIAGRLSHEKVSSLLVVEDAEKFTHEEEFECRNVPTDQAKVHYGKRIKEMSVQIAIQAASQKLKPYSDHGTTGMTYLDMAGKMTAATSINGLSMKEKGRVGNSSISDSGSYTDSKKGVINATGLGEDLMKGCISYEIVRLMGGGMHSQEAYETVVSYPGAELRERRGEAGDLSFIVINPKDEQDVATNIEGFPFAAVIESQEPAVYLVTRQEDSRCTHGQASDEWVENYMETRMASIEEQEYERAESDRQKASGLYRQKPGPAG